MRKLILTINVTPDGFCNHQDSVVGDDWMLFINDVTEQMGTAMFGRVTYKLFEEYWPHLCRGRILYSHTAYVFRFGIPFVHTDSACAEVARPGGNKNF
jgi:hypothetical protein